MPVYFIGRTTYIVLNIKTITQTSTTTMAKQENNTAKEILAEIKTDADSATCPGIFATLIATYCLAISVGYPDSDNQELCRIVWTGEVWELATNFMKGDLMEISAAQLVLNRMLETKWDDMQSICIGS